MKTWCWRGCRVKNESSLEAETRWQSTRTLSSPPLTSTPKSQLTAEQPLIKKTGRMSLVQMEDTRACTDASMLHPTENGRSKVEKGPIDE